MKLEAEIECPNCHRKLTQLVEKMRPGNSRTCSGCGATIQFTGDDGRKAQEAIDQFERAMRDISKSLKF